MKSLLQHISEKLIINNDMVTKSYINDIDDIIKNYNWSNNHLGLLCSEEIFDKFCKWLTTAKDVKEIKKTEMLEMNKNREYLMVIDDFPSRKTIILFHNYRGEPYSGKYSYAKISERIAEYDPSEQFLFKCNEDAGCEPIWPIQNINYAGKLKYYKITKKLLETVIKIYDDEWYR